MSREDGGSRLNDNGSGLGYVQSLVDKLSLTERKKLSDYLQQNLNKDIISVLPLSLASYLLGFLDAETLCKIRLVSKTWKDRATDNALWKSQCILAGFSTNLISKSFNYNKTAEDYFFQSYKHHVIVQKNWDRLNCSRYYSRAHNEGITCIAGSEHGDIIYTGSFDKTIKMWDLFNFKCLKVLKDHSEGVQCLTLGQFVLASGSWDKSIIVYDITNNHAIKHRLNGHLAGIISLTMNFNESILFSGSVDKTIRIWNVHTGDCLHRLYGHDGTVGTLMLIPRISSFTINEEQEEQQYWLISGSNDTSILVWDLNPSEEQLSNFQPTSSIKPQIYKRLEGNTRAVTCLAWYKELVQKIDDADQDHLDNSSRSVHINTINILSRSSSPCTNITREVELMDLDDSDSLIQSTNVNNEFIRHHCQRNHHNRLNQNNISQISSSPSNTVTPPPSPPENLNTSNHSNDMEFSDTNTPLKSVFIFSASADSTIRMWDLNTGQILHSTKEHTDIIWDLQCNESRLASVSSDGCIKYYQLNDSRSFTEPKMRSSFNMIAFPAVTLAHVDSGVTCLKMTREWLICGTEDGVLIAFEFFTRD